MSNRDVGGRRLNLQAALAMTVRASAAPVVGRGRSLGVVRGPLARAVDIAARGLDAVDRRADGGRLHVVAVGALARLSIRDTVAEARALGLGPLGLQVKPPEGRLVGAALLCLLFLTMIAVILVLVVLAIFGMAELNVQAIQARDWAAVGEPWKLGVLTVLAVGAVAIPLLLIVRLSLFAPATLGRRQMVSLNSMGIAYGSFWPLLAGLILTALPKIILLTLMGNGVLSGRAGDIVTVLVLVGLQLPLTIASSAPLIDSWNIGHPRRRSDEAGLFLQRRPRGAVRRVEAATAVPVRLGPADDGAGRGPLQPHVPRHRRHGRGAG